jgi:threonylcarbamoyladenosine tRNA methylthiotransferase MtaB
MRLFDQAVNGGSPEVVLSGIHIGRYGLDLQPQTTLTSLVRELLDRRKHARVRLSSIDPHEVTDGIIKMIGHGLCRHLHIPLQSGDDAILRCMNRHYTSGKYRDIVQSIVSCVPGIAIGADVMVGFPGEGDREFQNTYAMIESLPFTHLHVFSYSPRPGTPAAKMKGQVPERVKKMRNESLRGLALEKSLRFREQMNRQLLRVVLEGDPDSNGGEASGLSDNYIRVRVRGAKREHIGREINVLVTGLDETGLKGEITPTV